jgi:hypothetical protein
MAYLSDDQTSNGEARGIDEGKIKTAESEPQ